MKARDFHRAAIKAQRQASQAPELSHHEQALWDRKPAFYSAGRAHGMFPDRIASHEPDHAAQYAALDLTFRADS